MTRYLMNAAVIPHGCTGTFTYRLATIEELTAFIAAGDVVNGIAYQETLDWVTALTGQTFTVSRATYPLQPGDEAFVIRRTTRPTNTALI
jgi:STIV B116-like